MSNINWQQTLTLTAAHYRKQAEWQGVLPPEPYSAHLGAYPHKAGYRKDECSKEAARRIDGTLNERQEMVYKALKWHTKGATADQLAIALGKPPLSIKPRLTELAHMGKIRKSGRKGKTSMGGVCHIWEVNACNLTLNEDN